MKPAPWRIGTRRSPLSREQASLAQAFLHPLLTAELGSDFPPTKIVSFLSSGDRILDRPLADIGGKGLFTKEIDRALLDNEVDLAVHSAKDMESTLTQGTTIACYLPRGERRDCLVMRHPVAGGLQSLPQAATLGTSSPRREALVKTLRPDIRIRTLRGNIDRRLRSIDEGKNDAIVMARCALQRLGITVPLCMLDEEAFLPSAGQGAIALVVRSDDHERQAILKKLSNRACEIEVTAERVFLKTMAGSCYTPLGASAHLRGDELKLTAFVMQAGQKKQESLSGTFEQSETLGVELAHRLAQQEGLLATQDGKSEPSLKEVSGEGTEKTTKPSPQAPLSHAAG